MPLKRPPKLPLQIKLVLGFTLTLSFVFASTYHWFYRLASQQLIRRNQTIVEDTLTAALMGIDATDIAGLIQEGTARPDGHSNDTRYWNLVSWLSLVANTNPGSHLCVFLPLERETSDRILPVGCSANYEVTFLTETPNSLRFFWEDLDERIVSAMLLQQAASNDSLGVWMRGTKPIQTTNGEVVAYLGVALESSDLQGIQTRTRRYLALMFGATYAGLCVLTYVLANVITRRVKVLSRWASSVQQGDYGEKHGMPKPGWFADEVDDLAIAFQNMNRAIESRELALRASEETLERQVTERTQQLTTLLRSESTVRTILAKIQANFNESDILQTAVDELGAKLSVLGVSTALYDYTKDLAVIVNSHLSAIASDLAQGQVGSVFPLQSWHFFDMLCAGQSAAFCPLEAKQPLAMLACPIRDTTLADETVLGDLRLLKPAGEIFATPDIQLTQQVADVCAIALRQVRLHRQTEERLTQAETINHLKDDFLSTVSHELRTPITNMKMALKMLAITDPNNVDERQTRYLTILRDEVARESSLIDDLLDLQRLDAGKFGLTFEPIDLTTEIPQVLEPFSSRIQERNLCLETHISSDLPHILSDASAFNRILSELVNNACKYTPAGERIVVDAYPSPNNPHAVRVAVSNFGVTLPDEECDRIFEKFYRIPRSDVWKQGGTGLGLALVKGLVEQLKGAIGLENYPDHLQFCLDFPEFLDA